MRWQIGPILTFAIVSGRAMRVWGGSNYSVCNLESPFAGTFSHAKLDARPSRLSHRSQQETRLTRRPHTHGHDLRDVRMTITTISASDHHPQRTRVGQIATARATQPAARRNLRHSPRTFAHRTQDRSASASCGQRARASPVSRRYLTGISPVSRRYLAVSRGISPVSHRYLTGISSFPSPSGRRCTAAGARSHSPCGP